MLFFLNSNLSFCASDDLFAPTPSAAGNSTLTSPHPIHSSPTVNTVLGPASVSKLQAVINAARNPQAASNDNNQLLDLLVESPKLADDHIDFVLEVIGEKRPGFGGLQPVQLVLRDSSRKWITMKKQRKESKSICMRVYPGKTPTITGLPRMSANRSHTRFSSTTQEKIPGFTWVSEPDNLLLFWYFGSGKSRRWCVCFLHKATDQWRWLWSSRGCLRSRP